MDVRKLSAKVGQAFDVLLNLLAILAGIIMGLITVSVCVGVGSRYLLNRPITWVVEISEYGLLYITFLVAAWVLRQDKHVSLDLVYTRLSSRNQSIAGVFTSALAAIVFLMITFYGVKVTLHQFQTKYFTPTILEAPKFLITLIIPVGTFLLLIQIIRKVYQHLTNLVGANTSRFKEKEVARNVKIEP
jgi:C4-dicarboxylate transporter DctQ subunit